MADRRREEGGRVVVQIQRSKVPYLFALSVPHFSGYLPMIQCSICCIPCSDVACFHSISRRLSGKVIGGSCLLKLGLLEATESLIRHSFVVHFLLFLLHVWYARERLKKRQILAKMFSVVQ